VAILTRAPAAHLGGATAFGGGSPVPESLAIAVLTGLVAVSALAYSRWLRPSPRQTLALAAGAVSAAAAWAAPLAGTAVSGLVVVHVAAETSLAVVGAPLLVLAVPLRLWQLAGSWRGPLARAFRFATAPVVATVALNAWLLVLQVPETAALGRSALGWSLEAGALLVFALAMWWRLLAPSEALGRLAAPLAMLVFFVDGVSVTLLATYVLFAGHPLYGAYAVAERAAGLSGTADQQLAAVVLKSTTELVYGLGLVAGFVRWVRPARGGATPSPSGGVRFLRGRNPFGIGAGAPLRGSVPAKVIVFPERGERARDGSKR
jgi:cytochrome c oxidase assembly factor CtaG